MRTCPACEFTENPDMSLICIHCGAILPDTRETQSQVVVRKATGILSGDTGVFEPHMRNQHINKMKRGDVALYIGDTDEPTIVPVLTELFLGRASADEENHPSLLDLTPHGAQENGVSRHHAVLRRLGGDVVIVDQGSTNGTRLNGMRLTAHDAVVLRSGDRIQLGKFKIQIFLSG